MILLAVRAEDGEERVAVASLERRDDREAELFRLTREQIHVLEMMGHNKRLLVEGCAGSGKTVLALSLLGLVPSPGRVVGGRVLDPDGLPLAGAEVALAGGERGEGAFECRTGQDHLFGGWGDDLLNADDDHDSTSGSGDPRANDTPDGPVASYEDIAYGGALNIQDYYILWIPHWVAYEEHHRRRAEPL